MPRRSLRSARVQRGRLVESEEEPWDDDDADASSQLLTSRVPTILQSASKVWFVKYACDDAEMLPSSASAARATDSVSAASVQASTSSSTQAVRPRASS